MNTLPWYAAGLGAALLWGIHYPLFVVLFTWLLFRQVHVTPSAAIGGVLVMAGAALIIWNHP
ncbi:hypothetical protein [Thioalkalivibrio sulfidiphilus]|uniref:hypothetical protein n=1 Tax=Thioalkalivibrio sulfidiphilus TaxID=1033854 RepID=UPI00036533B0|nr:hypothetical protein [Thioalkalivibrio sulfidiphilus]